MLSSRIGFVYFFILHSDVHVHVTFINRDNRHRWVFGVPKIFILAKASYCLPFGEMNGLWNLFVSLQYLVNVILHYTSVILSYFIIVHFVLFSLTWITASNHSYPTAFWNDV